MKTELRFSKYNHIVELEKDREWGLINLFTMSACRFSSLEKALFEGALETLDTDLCRKWKRLGFLVDYDERFYYKAFHNKYVHDKRSLELVICPTLSCNFKCPYCFENEEQGSMPREVQDALIDFTRDYINNLKPRNINVYWFGGEPLLYPDIIDYISEKLIKLCDDNHINYSAKMDTNGYFLNQDMIKRLEKNRVVHIQVTIDGTEENHNKTRVLKDGTGTYERIMDNLKNIHTNIHICIRSNITKNNGKKEFDALKKEMEEISLSTKNSISVIPAHMDIMPDMDDGAGAFAKENLLPFSDYWDSPLFKDYDSYGKIVKKAPAVCNFCKVSAFTIAPNGDIYKCCNSVGKEDYKVSSLSDKGRIFFDQLHSYAGSIMMGTDVTEDEECRECKFLPQCNGGCLYMLDAFGKESVCKKAYYEKNIDELVRRMFERKEEC